MYMCMCICMYMCMCICMCTCMCPCMCMCILHVHLHVHVHFACACACACAFCMCTCMCMCILHVRVHMPRSGSPVRSCTCTCTCTCTGTCTGLLERCASRPLLGKVEEGQRRGATADTGEQRVLACAVCMYMSFIHAHANTQASRALCVTLCNICCRSSRRVPIWRAPSFD